MRSLLLLVACTSSPVDINGQGSDLSVVFDLGFDLLRPDLFTCGSRSDTGVESKSVINAVSAPLDRTQFAIDFNGDGKVDNQYGNIVGALAANNLDSQTALTAAIQAGSDLGLVDLTAMALDNDPCVTATMQVAQQHTNPDFSGSGSFTPDPSFLQSSFPGAIGTGLYLSSSDSAPVALTIQLPFAGVLVPTTLIGAHLRFRVSANGTLMTGQINGALKATDVQSTFIPDAAQRLNLLVTQNPTSVQSRQLLQVFDIGCANGMGVKNDGRIDDCEVGSNSIILNVLQPDVQLFDAQGNFHPNPANATRDSLSVGLGFTAVGASF